jgi:hypothetical protein
MSWKEKTTTPLSLQSGNFEPVEQEEEEANSIFCEHIKSQIMPSALLQEYLL